MKTRKFTRFLGKGLFLVLVAVLLFSLMGAGYAQQEVRAIRQTGTSAYKIDPGVGSDLVSSIALCNIYDSLVFPTPDGNVKPWLAKSWEASEDGMTYIFELVPGVKFHNGDELTAEDVVFTLERIMTIGEGYGYLFTKNVAGAKALEKYKVQFDLKKPFGPFLGALVRLYILNKNQVMENIQEGPYGEYGDYGKDWLVTHDAGSGPYLVKENKVPEYLLVEKYDDYWAGWENQYAPQYWQQLGTREAITVKTLFSRGELEISDSWQTNENYTVLDQMPNIDISGHFEGTVMNIMLNTKKPPTDDIHFRKALAYCVDYQQIIEDIYPGCKLSYGPVASGTPGWNPNLKPYTLDLAKAEEELKQSPYYGKLDQYPIELHWLQTAPDEEKVALMLQANVSKLGVKVNIVKNPWLSMVNNMATPETTAHASIIFVSPHYPEAGSMLESRYHSGSCGTWEQGEWLQDPEIDAMIDDAIATLDREERFQKYYVIQEKIMELCPTIFIGEQVNKHAYRTDYVVFPVAEAIKQGKPANPVMGYNFYFRDFQVFPEKANPPYVPFKP